MASKRKMNDGYEPLYTKKLKSLQDNPESNNSKQLVDECYTDPESTASSSNSGVPVDIYADAVPGTSQSITATAKGSITLLSERRSEEIKGTVKFSWNYYVTSKWCAVSKRVLEESETGILSCLSSTYNRRYVQLDGKIFGQEVRIWTVSMNESSTEVPIVLIHGFGSGSALWALNLDILAKDRPVYAIDVPGFAQSSRPKFAETPEEVELQFVRSIEDWRIKMNIPYFIILGHSLGGFISTAYTIQYPERVQHLILADPWGFQEKPAKYKGIGNMPYPLFTFMRLLEPLNINPLWSLRLAGRMGPQIIQYFRSELVRSFHPEIRSAEKLVSNYIFQCNAQEPTGEQAFLTLMKCFGWAKNPMVNRFHLLRPDLPVTLIYGENTWIDHVPVDILQRKRGESSLIDFHILQGTGHHVYTDKNTLHLFNKIVANACFKLRDEDAQVAGPTEFDINEEEMGNEQEISEESSFDSGMVDYEIEFEITMTVNENHETTVEMEKDENTKQYD